MFDIKQGIDILSLEAKDIYIANKYEDKTIGVNPRYVKGDKKGEYILSKFINKLDYSLCLVKIKEVYEKVYRNNKFVFLKDNHNYTTRVINVTFKYSVKEFNKINSTTYIKLGLRFDNMDFDDGVCIKDNELIGIQTNMNINDPISSELLGNTFCYKNGKYQIEEGKNKTIVTTKELREKMYKEGFVCDGINFKRFMRSSGSARVGKCLFIDKNLYPKVMKWAMNKIKIKEGDVVDLASLESYISLSLSSIIDTIKVKPENILVIDDYESAFDDNVIETNILNGKLLTSPSVLTIKNSIWDGQSLMDISLFDKYSDKGMLLLRNRFFKSCCFNTNIQKWFKDNNITDVSQLNGFTLAKDITDVKLITTPSSIKYLKFGLIKTWLNELEEDFGVVKYEKPTHYLDGKLVKSHYQLLNSLQLSKKDIESIVQPSLDYLDKIKDDPSILRYHIKYPDNDIFDDSPISSKNDIVYKLLGINKDFSKTKMYHQFKADLVTSFVKDIRRGHVLINGNYSTMCGNPINMLQSSIGVFKGLSDIGIGNIFTSNFRFNKTLLGSRSPHVCSGNILLTKNTKNEMIIKYMNFTNEIVYINSIKENTLNRLSGCDFDSDTLLLTDNEFLIKAAKKNYDNFLVPTSNVQTSKISRRYNSEQLSDLDIKTSSNLIGDIINLSQELENIIFNNLNNGSTIEEIEDLYRDTCQLDVMSGIEIDRAKKEFDVSMSNEIKRIKDKWIRKDDRNKIIKPYFFYFINSYKGYTNMNKFNYMHHDTSMDYLERIINKYQRKRTGIKNEPFLKFYKILNKSIYNHEGANRKQARKVMLIITDLKNKSSSIYKRRDLKNDNDDIRKYMVCNTYRTECINHIGKLKINSDTMIYMLKKFDTDETSHIYKTLFNVLFGYPNTYFYNVIKENKEKLDTIAESDDGDIELFGYSYKKIQKAP